MQVLPGLCGMAGEALEQELLCPGPITVTSWLIQVPKLSGCRRSAGHATVLYELLWGTGR